MRIQGPLLLHLYQYAMNLIQSLLKTADEALLTLADFDLEHHIHNTKLWSPVSCVPIQPSDKLYGFCAFIHVGEKKKVLEVFPHHCLGT